MSTTDLQAVADAFSIERDLHTMRLLARAYAAAEASACP